MNTPAYKAERMIFREFIEKAEPKEPISFVQDIGMSRNLTEGPITPTGNDLDLAISGPGYFSVKRRTVCGTRDMAGSNWTDRAS